MAYRTWGRALLAALGAGVLAGATQLGVGYGLGIVRFARDFDAALSNRWTGQLTWVAWFAISATVIGAVVAEGVASRIGHRSDTIGSRLAIATSAGLGGAAVAPLSMLPARAAQVPTVDPVLIVGLVGGLGALLGIFAALAALSLRPLVWNLATVAGGVWTLALVSVLPSMGPHDPLPVVRLGVLDPAGLSEGVTQRLSVVTMAAIALAAGAATGGLARWLGRPFPVVATAGLAGPATLALAYLLAGPGGSADRYQAAPYWGALLAVATGAVGSGLAATLRWPAAGTSTRSATHTSTRSATEQMKSDETPPPATAGPVSDAGPDEEVRGAAAARTPGGGPSTEASSEPVTEPPPGDAARSRPVPLPPPGTRPVATGTEPGTRIPTTADFWPGTPTRSGPPPTTSTPASDKPASDEPASDNEPGRRDGRTRRWPFRRNGPGTPPAGPATPGEDSAPAGSPVPRQRSAPGGGRGQDDIPTHDEEYVDWVNGLATPEPPADKPPGDRADRPLRRLRSPGRHQVD